MVTRKNKRIKKSICSLSAKISSPTIRDVIFSYVLCTTKELKSSKLFFLFFVESAIQLVVVFQIFSFIQNVDRPSLWWNCAGKYILRYAIHKDQSCSFFILSSVIWKVKQLIWISWSEKCKLEVLRNYIWKLEDSRLLCNNRNYLHLSIWKLLYKVSHNFIGFVAHNWFFTLLWKSPSLWEISDAKFHVEIYNNWILSFQISSTTWMIFATRILHRPGNIETEKKKSFTKFSSSTLKTVKHKFKYHHKM